MNKQSEDKATITNTIDPTKPVNDQLGEQDLEKVTGGTTATKTISWTKDDEGPKETTTFEYGGLVIRY
jgi:hypothetical protein